MWCVFHTEFIQAIHYSIHYRFIVIAQAYLKNFNSLLCCSWFGFELITMQPNNIVLVDPFVHVVSFVSPWGITGFLISLNHGNISRSILGHVTPRKRWSAWMQSSLTTHFALPRFSSSWSMERLKSWEFVDAMRTDQESTHQLRSVWTSLVQLSFDWLESVLTENKKWYQEMVSLCEPGQEELMINRWERSTSRAKIGWAL